MLNRVLFLLLTLLASIAVLSQDSAFHLQISPDNLDQIRKESSRIEKKIGRKAEQVLQKFQKQENKLKAKLVKVDSLAAKQLFLDATEKYKALKDNLPATALQPYIPRMDSLKTALKFLQLNPTFITQANEVKARLKETMAKMNALKSQVQKAENIKQFLKERRQYLKDQLSRFGLGGKLKKINKQVYYYSGQLSEYKSLLNDPKKSGRKALELLSKNKLFQDFWRKNSELAALFHLPGDDASAGNMTSLAGLQTRAQVNALIQQQLAAGGPDAQSQLQQGLNSAQAQIAQLKNKVMKMGGRDSDMEMPEGFHANPMRTKSFLERLELGTNIQSVRSNGLFPTTTDLAVTLGFKASDLQVIGIGINYKLGWGKNIPRIRFTHQGVGVRSFIDWKLKGALWISGGFEMNYRAEIRNIAELNNYSAWQRSGLIGLGRKIPIKTKFFKNTKVQVMWDYLSYYEIPRPQSILVRFGYNL